MRRLIAIVLSSALAASAAMAADTASLAPGKPAGVKQAQDVGLNTTAWVLRPAWVGLLQGRLYRLRRRASSRLAGQGWARRGLDFPD